MSKQKITALIIAVVVVGAAASAVAFAPKKQMNNPQRPNSQASTTVQQAPDQNNQQTVVTTSAKDSTNSKTTTKTDDEKTDVSTAPLYTVAQVATHDNAQSCWTIVRGNVYDVTKWISEHPGGSQAILGLCGKDGTSLFEGQHGGQKQPESTIASFKIGTLQK